MFFFLIYPNVAPYKKLFIKTSDVRYKDKVASLVIIWVQTGSFKKEEQIDEHLCITTSQQKDLNFLLSAPQFRKWKLEVACCKSVWRTTGREGLSWWDDLFNAEETGVLNKMMTKQVNTEMWRNVKFTIGIKKYYFYILCFMLHFIIWHNIHFVKLNILFIFLHFSLLYP